MNSKHSGFFFLFLICTSHIGSSLAGISKPPKTREGCEITSELELKIDHCLKRVSLRVEKDIQVEDQSKDGFKFSDFHCQNLHQMKKTTHCTCECYKDFIRFFVNVSIFDVFFVFFLSLDHIFGKFFAHIVDALVAFFQKVNHLHLKLSHSKIDLVIVLEQRFTGGPCSVIDVVSVGLGEVKIFGKELPDHYKGLMKKAVDPFMKIALRKALVSLIPLIKDEFQKLVIEKGWHNCPTTTASNPNATLSRSV